MKVIGYLKQPMNSLSMNPLNDNSNNKHDHNNHEMGK